MKKELAIFVYAFMFTFVCWGVSHAFTLFLHYNTNLMWWDKYNQINFYQSQYSSANGTWSVKKTSPFTFKHSSSVVLYNVSSNRYVRAALVNISTNYTSPMSNAVYITYFNTYTTHPPAPKNTRLLPLILGM